ncbi:MAG TPA: AraC family transcriptional regulator [Feifaniaceae bacterium]|nr:AraC family transcriptional regulator [Feifaniaceae bacterium]
MREQTHIERKLVHMAFLQREYGFSHHAYDKELLQYEYVRDGDMRAVEEGARMFNGDGVGHLSDDPVRDKRYLFVAATTLTTRFAIEGGLDQETAYNLSDLFIQRMDTCGAVEEIGALHRVMVEEFARRVAEAPRRRHPKAVLLALDYIYLHLHEQIGADQIAAHVGLSRSYLSTLFKREMGVPLSDYIREKRVEAAKNMLKFSDFTLQEIGNYLAFHSQSHFVSVFRALTGVTPGAYRRAHFRSNWGK